MSRKRKKNTGRRFDPATKGSGRRAAAELGRARQKAEADGKVVQLTELENAHRRMLYAGWDDPGPEAA